MCVCARVCDRYKNGNKETQHDSHQSSNLQREHALRRRFERFVGILSKLKPKISFPSRGKNSPPSQISDKIQSPAEFQGPTCVTADLSSAISVLDTLWFPIRGIPLPTIAAKSFRSSTSAQIFFPALPSPVKVDEKPRFS